MFLDGTGLGAWKKDRLTRGPSRKNPGRKQDFRSSSGGTGEGDLKSWWGRPVPALPMASRPP